MSILKSRILGFWFNFLWFSQSSGFVAARVEDLWACNASWGVGRRARFNVAPTWKPIKWGESRLAHLQLLCQQKPEKSLHLVYFFIRGRETYSLISLIFERGINCVKEMVRPSSEVAAYPIIRYKPLSQFRFRFFRLFRHGSRSRFADAHIISSVFSPFLLSDWLLW